MRVRKLKNNKTGGSYGLVGELLKYGGPGVIDLLQQLFAVVWREEFVPLQWREGSIVHLFKKGDKEDPGNYRGITLLTSCACVFTKRGWHQDQTKASFWRVLCTTTSVSSGSVPALLCRFNYFELESCRVACASACHSHAILHLLKHVL